MSKPSLVVALALLLALGCVHAPGPAAPTAPASDTVPFRGAAAADAPGDGDAPVLVVQTGHTEGINALVFSADGRVLFSGGFGRQIFQWDLLSGKLLRVLPVDGGTQDLVVTPDGRHLVATSIFGKGQAWEIATAVAVVDLEPFRSFVFPINRGARRPVAESRDGTLRATTTFYDVGTAVAGEVIGPAVQLWDVKSQRLLRTLMPRMEPLLGFALSRDGKLLASFAGVSCGHVRLWNLETGRVERTLLLPDAVASVALSAEGRLLAVATDDEATYEGGRVELWDTATGQKLRSLPHLHGAQAVAFSADGRFLVSAGKGSIPRKPGELKIWEPSSGKLLHTVVLPKEAQYSVATITIAIGGDDRSVVLGNFTQTYGIWDLESGASRRNLPPQQYFHFALSPDGARLLTVTNNPDHILYTVEELASGKVLYALRIHRIVQSSALLHPDGTSLSVGDMNGNITRYDLRTGAILQEVQAHAADVRVLALTADGQRVISGSQDGTLKLWRERDFQLVATLLPVGDQEFVSTLPGGAYSASAEGVRAVAFRVGDRAVPGELLDLRFSRPDLVAAALGGQGGAAPLFHRAFERRLEKLGLTEAMLTGSLQLPTVKLRTDLSGFTTKEKKLRLSIEAADPHGLLERLHVRVNDVPVDGAEGFDLRPQASGALKRELEVALTPGANKIQVSVVSARGAESARETLEIVCDLPARKPELFVVAIGVSEYSDVAQRLRFASKDARDVSRFFAAMPVGELDAFRAVHVLTLVDGDATREKIAAAKQFLAQSTVDDQAIVFAAGHGLVDEQLDYYFATVDVDFQHPAARGVGYDQLEGLLDRIPARRRLLLIDTCFSGEIEKERAVLLPSAAAPAGSKLTSRGFRRVGRSGDDAAALQRAGSLFADWRRTTGAVVISSASGSEFALESPQWSNGVFTYALLTGLQTRGADFDHDTRVRVSELRDYVSVTVASLTGGQQTPNVRRQNLEFNFELVKIPAEVR